MKTQGGYTLTELLVVSAIVAILLGIGVPSYRYLTTNYRMSAEINALLGDLQFARYEAIKEGQPVTVCSSSDGATCSGNNTWQAGWVIFSNPLVAAQPPLNSVLRVQRGFTGTTPDTFATNPAVSSISYNREGFANTGAGFPQATMTLTESTNNVAYQRCLFITPQGVPSTATHAISPGLC
ncbi:MAG: GspH/FimT family pseudopilin [Gammaproteobacteria bacterium]|nr:GspH/FimT family pseudopilin [Gammaproteobacteria bacterium]MBV9621878.1 GspH/FimT family pseudopilin [Gammaproteobacteria bacterium]